MAVKVPTTRSIDWVSLLPQFAVLFGLVIVLDVLNVPQPILVGSVLYLVLAIALKLGLTGAHRKGIHAVKAGRFTEAIPYFERSRAYFEERPWLDRYRYLLLLSSSAWSYREMAMANKAFSLSQLGMRTDAINSYEEVLREYPESALATVPLRMMLANDTRR